MSKNPKVTITLAFVLTFLLGTGAGYLLCGTMHSHADRQAFTGADDLAGTEQIAPVPAPDQTTRETAEAEEPITQARERRGAGDGAGDGSGAGMTRGEGPGTGQGHRAAAEKPESDKSAEKVVSEPELTLDTNGVQEEEPEVVPEERRRSWRSRTDDEDGTRFSRFRQRLVRDLSLSEDEAGEFFSVLETHRRQVREEVIIPQRELNRRHRELTEKLENDLESILSEEQMATWRERYAPRLERRAEDGSDRRIRRETDNTGDDSPENDQ